jgi:two-component system sensor histidine kinase KdpD
MKTPRARRIAVATLTSVACLAVVTAAIALFEPYVPVLSLGALYLFAVLPVAVLFGIEFAIPVSVASMLAFNWFFLPPVHTFTLAERTNWFALAVYLATSVVVSELAARARRRAAAAEQRERESALLAELATELLGGRDLEGQLAEIARRASVVLGVDHAEIELGVPRRPPRGHAPHPLEVEGRPVGTIYTPEDADPSVAVRRRFLPALAALLAVAADRDRLETIEVETDRLARLVGNLLDLSRLEAGAAEPAREVWAIDDLVRESVGALGASDRVEVGGEGPLVNVDAAQIERVLANLVENALKFSPSAAPVHVRITATRKEVIVRVVDRGPGLTEEELERVFEPFFRRPGDPRSGAGVGLAIARGFAEANGGRLWAESRPGQGASFALALPVAEVPAGLPA